MVMEMEIDKAGGSMKIMKETQVISVRVAPEIKRKLEEVADQEMRTLTNMLSKIITDYPTAKKVDLKTERQQMSETLDSYADDVLKYLNEKTGRRFVDNKHIKARMNDKKNPASIDQCELVIDFKFKKWNGTKFEQYLRPSTLFSGKFYEYLAEAEKNLEMDQQYDAWRDSDDQRGFFNV